MKKIVATALAMSLAATMASCSASKTEADNIPDKTALQRLTPPPPDRTQGAVTDTERIPALAVFCAELHKVVSAENNQKSNTLTSPLSAYIALSMVKEGALGDTLAQMQSAMGNIGDKEIYSVLSHLTALEETTLNIANSVWLDNRFEPSENFLQTLAESYLAEGFKTDLKYAEDDINLWIEEHTNGLIKNMLDDSALDESVMALVNTVYMKATWANEFAPDMTHERQFTNADKSSSTVEFMYKKANQKFIESEDFIGVSLPYSDGSLEFVALMPKDANTPSTALADDIRDRGGFAEIIDGAEVQKVELYLPRFEQKMNGSLVKTLKQMGIINAFEPKLADFSGIADAVFVQDVIQSAVLKLDEAGTEAAAATVISVMPTSMPMPEPEPRVVEFNRPFVFGVVDTDTGAVLFCGERNFAD